MFRPICESGRAISDADSDAIRYTSYAGERFFQAVMMSISRLIKEISLFSHTCNMTELARYVNCNIGAELA